ncbi:MAG: hypothetical protein V1843_03070 [bacterium]
MNKEMIYMRPRSVGDPGPASESGQKVESGITRVAFPKTRAKNIEAMVDNGIIKGIFKYKYGSAEAPIVAPYFVVDGKITSHSGGQGFDIPQILVNKGDKFLWLTPADITDLHLDFAGNPELMKAETQEAIQLFQNGLLLLPDFLSASEKKDVRAEMETGTYGEATRKAVAKFKKAAGISGNGNSIDIETMTKLYLALGSNNWISNATEWKREAANDSGVESWFIQVPMLE